MNRPARISLRFVMPIVFGLLVAGCATTPLATPGEDLWTRACGANKVSLFVKYAKAYPQGEHAGEAPQKIESLLTGPNLILAAKAGDRDEVAAILQREPGLVSAVDERGFSALHYAAAPGSDGNFRFFMDYNGTVAALIEHGADVNARLPSNMTPKWYDGMTPLHGTMFYQTYSEGTLAWKIRLNDMPLNEFKLELLIEIVKLLLASGADVNATADSGDTALHIAAGRGRTEMVRLLLNSGADPSILNSNSQSAPDLAKEHDQADVITLLQPTGPAPRSSRKP